MPRLSPITILNDSTFLFIIIIIIIIISFDVGSCTKNPTIACPEIEKRALLSLFRHDENKKLLPSSWKNFKDDCCSWEGVLCNNLTGHVVELSLRGYGFSGKNTSIFDSSLLDLKHLRYLDLSRNDFREKIPPFIGSIVTLEELNLSRAGFLGAIPSTIGNLSNLRILDLQADFEAEFERSGPYSDNLDWLSRLSVLEELNLNSVDLSKASNWLSVLSKLRSLSELRLQGCKLDWSASITDSTVNFSSSVLTALDLSRNYFESLVFPRWTLRIKGLKFLDLSENFIEGPIPSVSNGTELEFVDLSYNRLNSTVPDWLYSCNNLQFVYLQGNSLAGAISNGFSNLSSVVVLDLHTNKFDGNVSRGLWRSCRTRVLDLSGNELQGELLDFFVDVPDCLLESLEYLYLNWNQFSGRISDRFGNLRNLRVLDVSGNSISGVVPFGFGELSSLEILNLRSNKFVGNLPEALGKLSNLKRFDVSNNSLEGVLTEGHFIDLKNLDVFDASENQLTFRVSPKWVPPFQLSALVLQSTYINGSVPSWLITQQNIVSLYLSNSGVRGLVPRWVWNISNVDLSSNDLYGDINFGNHSLSQSIYLSSNQISGSLPLIPRNMVLLDLSDNLVSGRMSNAICDGNSTEPYALRVLDLGGNQLSGELPYCWTSLKNLEALNLRDNDLYGRIGIRPSVKLEELKVLNLRNNAFSGRIPPLIAPKLSMIDISDNYFRGNLPKWTELNSDSLRFVILRSNKLSGRIDSSICSLSSIQILDISNNDLHGTIPSCLHNFTALVQSANLASSSLDYERFGVSIVITTKGQERSYDVLLPLVTSIDLSNNSLSGNIPPEFTRLVSLRQLTLSRNKLTGFIPENVGKMKNLESLDLSLNSLTGEIPLSLASMTSLNYLNISYNNLTGRLPESTQLQSMDASSFVGNQLCGPPLTASKCGADKDDGGNNDGATVSSHRTEVNLVILLSSLGYAVGLSSFCAVMILHRSLRAAYFEMLEDILKKIMSSLKRNR